MTMMDMLTAMMAKQAELQARINGYDIDQQDAATRIENIKLNVLACTAELHEALAETGWKPWATSQHINEEQFKTELIDAWHFLMNLFLHAGMMPTEIWARYNLKWKINMQRQEDGYDGVSTKCLACGRNLDDPNNIFVNSSASAFVPNRTTHCVCGQVISVEPL